MLTRFLPLAAALTFFAFPTLAAETPSAPGPAGLTISVAEIAGGSLRIAGTAAKANVMIRLQGAKVTAKSNAAKAFAIEAAAYPEGCVAVLAVGSAMQRVVIGNCGPQGEPGARGQRGAPGPRGAAGVAGAKGLDGAAGATGPIGATGPAGPMGPAGPINPLALDCVETEFSVWGIPPTSPGSATAPDCPAGYTETTTYCRASSYLVSLVVTGSGVCGARNYENVSRNLSAARRCCRVPAAPTN